MSRDSVVTVTIDRVGAEGDGIATAPDGTTLYIPYTLPGETVRVGPEMAVLRASDSRVAAPCAHFGECGGCVVQHWNDPGYRGWKTALLQTALRRAGFMDVPIAPLQVTPPKSRRRMDLAVRRTPRGVRVGLHRRATQAGARASSPDVCDLTECHVLHPALFALVEPLRPLLAKLHAMRREGSIVANLLDDGVDLLLRTDAALDRADRQHLIDFARTHRLPRVSHAPMKGEAEPIIIMQPPRIALSGTSIEPAPGAFLQASREGEAAIVQAVLAGLPPKLPPRARIAELYAGSGSLTFALAQHARVVAWEGDACAVTALRQASNRAGLAGRITVTQRDLARQPLLAAELAGFAAVVLDPPFAGAAEQMAQIASVKVARVVYVSCNPAVLARDARILREAGYGLVGATPIDQFLWSARLESVCVFSHA